MKLRPALKSYLWGGTRLKARYGRDNGNATIAESWEVSVHPDGPSRIDGGTLADYLSAHPDAVDREGSPLPVLIKYIDAQQKLSVQVHPSDAYARRVEGDNGKTEMWYIIDADEGAGIYCGFRRDTSREEFLAALKEERLPSLLNFIPVKRGDAYLIPAGTVHAIGAGCFICEVQESSNVTYRVYDYGRRDATGALRPLHLEKALEVMNFSVFSDETGRGKPQTLAGGTLQLLTACGHFTAERLSLDGTFSRTDESSFTAVNILEGEGKACGEPFAAGDSFFIPRGTACVLTGRAEAILTKK